MTIEHSLSISLGKLADQRDEFTGRRHRFSNEQHEHGECQQHRQAQRDFLTGFRRQVERQTGQTRQHDARDDHIRRVVQGSTTDMKVELQVVIGLLAARIVQRGKNGPRCEQLPFA